MSDPPFSEHWKLAWAWVRGSLLPAIAICLPKHRLTLQLMLLGPLRIIPLLPLLPLLVVLLYPFHLPQRRMTGNGPSTLELPLLPRRLEAAIIHAQSLPVTASCMPLVREWSELQLP